MKAYDIKKGNVVEHSGGVYQVRDIERSSPQGRGGNVRFRFVMYSIPGGNKRGAHRLLFDSPGQRALPATAIRGQHIDKIGMNAEDDAVHAIY